MLCTHCHEVTVPETVLSGSDFAELVAWSCFALPGYLYCAWRHWNRVKARPECGSHALMRESRASRARNAAVEDAWDRVRNEDGPARWPRGLRSPRQRLRIGLLGALPAGLALLAWLCDALGWVSEPPWLVSVLGLGLSLSGLWVVANGLRVARLELAREPVAAWDHEGRALRIERL